MVTGVTNQPSYEMTKRVEAKASATANYDAEAHTYTVEVSHNGAVDLTLHCTGNATDRQTDVLPMTSLSADLPKQPEDYHGEIIIEAEDMDFMGIKSCVTDPYGRYPNVRGHAGNGFADMGTSTSGALRHQLNVKHPGDYTITATSRVTNVWAFVVTILVVLLAVGSLFYRRADDEDIDM